MQAARDRIKVAGDILDYAELLPADDRFCYDEAAFDKHIRKPPEAAGLLRKLRERLATVEPFDAADAGTAGAGFRAGGGH